MSNKSQFRHIAGSNIGKDFLQGQQRHYQNLRLTFEGSICEVNQTMFQAFEWYTAADQDHWVRLSQMLPSLKAIGIENIWLPPGCKAASPNGNGYDIYDLYDLGEFDQKGGRKTKWGSKSDLLEFSRLAQKYEIGLYWDTVLNHKAAADKPERCLAVEVHPKDRLKEIGMPKEIEAWTGFEFPGRSNKYSHMKYSWNNFSGIGYDNLSHTRGIYRFIGEGKPGWASDVDNELGNYDYLMFANLDYTQAEVRSDVLQWAIWISSELQLAGMRLDAMKHYSEEFQISFVKTMQKNSGKKFFIVGEYWKSDSDVLSKKIKKFEGMISLFDVQLVYNLSDISLGKKSDLRCVLDGTLVQLHPKNTVTFVANHDTQEFQSLAAPVEEWFIPHAYSLILLREDGYPCVFYGDLQGISGPRPRQPACGGKLPKLILARKFYAYGKQRDYFDLPDCVGWTRLGHRSLSNGAGLAVILTNSWNCEKKRMYVGQRHAYETWTDIMNWAWGEVIIDGRGFGTFPVGHRAMGVWTASNATGREIINAIGSDQVQNMII